MATTEQKGDDIKQVVNIGQGKIFQALSDVMADVTAVGKDSQNKAQGFNFRGIDAILNMVAPALRNHGVTVVPIVEDKQYDLVPTKSGGTMGHAVLTVRYRFTAVDGSYIETVVYGEAMDSGDKTYAKAMSVAFRTALIQCLAIPTNDRDPDEDSYERGNSHQQESKKVELPADLVALLDSATTTEELVAIGAQVRNTPNLDPAVSKAL